MQYREIVAVTGLGGLFQLIASKQDGAIVRSLEDKSTRFVSSRVHNFTPLESIEVFTTGDNVNLAEVFKAMQEQEASFPLVDTKADNNTIKAYFKSVYPEFDEERVYVSDMKKMVKWFVVLKANDLLKFEEILAGEEEEAVAAEVAEEAPKAKKAAAATEATEEEKPKKPRATKKAAKEEGEEDAEAAEKAPKKAKAKKEDAPAAEGEAPKKAAKPRKKKAEEE